MQNNKISAHMMCFSVGAPNWYVVKEMVNIMKYMYYLQLFKFIVACLFMSHGNLINEKYSLQVGSKNQHILIFVEQNLASVSQWWQFCVIIFNLHKRFNLYQSIYYYITYNNEIRFHSSMMIVILLPLAMCLTILRVLWGCDGLASLLTVGIAIDECEFKDRCIVYLLHWHQHRCVLFHNPYNIPIIIYFIIPCLSI